MLILQQFPSPGIAGQCGSGLTTGQKFIIRLSMKLILKHIYHVGDSECSVCLVDSGEGLVPIDAG